MDAPLFRYWQALYLSFYSRRLYIDVAKRWRGFGLLYCFLILSIAVIPLSVRTMIHFNDYIEQALIAPMKKIPMLQVRHGDIVFDKPMPYFIKNSAGEDIIIIDTTGHVTEMSPQYPHLIMLINKKEYFFRSPALPFMVKSSLNHSQFQDHAIEHQSLDGIANGVFDANHWVQTSGITTLKKIVVAFVYPLMLSSFFGLFATLLMILAMMGQVFSYVIFKYKLTFKPACRVMMVSSGIGISLFLFLNDTSLHIPGMGLYCMILVVGYFSFAVLSVKRDSYRLVF